MTQTESDLKPNRTRTNYFTESNYLRPELIRTSKTCNRTQTQTDKLKLFY